MQINEHTFFFDSLIEKLKNIANKYEFVIVAATKIENILQHIFGASGCGINALVFEIKNHIAVTLCQKIKQFAHERNQLCHKLDYFLNYREVKANTFSILVQMKNAACHYVENLKHSYKNSRDNLNYTEALAILKILKRIPNAIKNQKKFRDRQAECYYFLGVQLFQQFQTQKAIDILQQSIKCKETSWGFYRLAQCKIAIGKFHEARYFLQKAERMCQSKILHNQIATLQTNMTS